MLRVGWFRPELHRLGQVRVHAGGIGSDLLVQPPQALVSRGGHVVGALAEGGLAEHECSSEVDEEIEQLERAPRRQAGPPKSADGDVAQARGLRPESDWTGDEHRHDRRMGYENLANRIQQASDRLLPTRSLSLLEHHLAEQLSDHRVEQCVLALDVPVEGHRRNAQLGGHAPECQLLEPTRLRHANRSVDDPPAIETGSLDLWLERLEVGLELRRIDSELDCELGHEGIVRPTPQSYSRGGADKILGLEPQALRTLRSRHATSMTHAVYACTILE
ncbi:MAG: hypothetical protein HW413_1756 [Thermoleophilia bacterium]|nr:hypothetical protein [Thermoleophilia bacterium]